MTNKVIDRYSIELEMPADLAQPGLSVRSIATNTEDGSPPEAWRALESTRALLNFAYGHEKDIVDSLVSTAPGSPLRRPDCAARGN